MKAARKHRGPIAEHVASCEECRTELALSRLMAHAGPNELEMPSPEALERFAATALVHEPDRPQRSRVGSLTFDSWQERSVANVRDLPEGLVRRICLSAGAITLEIVAERQHGGWEFVGRVYDGQEARAGFMLKVGRKRLLPKAGGFYFWKSKSAPRTIALVSGDLNLEFDSPAW